ncbi:MAG TPA: geranylgeranylglyceryl/heptaprenylglyceryl phosphate synthase [Bacteroidales bacterium]|nr:geranylgeranylglyceryl/heptaprenylglyceryl phosphate synthase [Bacteroidales bacterium]
MTVYNQIITRLQQHNLFVLLIDPDAYDSFQLLDTIMAAKEAEVDFILVGGSLISGKIDETIIKIKELCSIPVIIFPGSLLQLSDKADAMFLLSLISGRNPDFLIGNHVVAAPMLKRFDLEVIPTGYLLVDRGAPTSVEYMSNTRPIPGNKPEIAVATAMAGEMLGLKLIYLEAGSGAGNPPSIQMVKEVRNNISVPLIVGGGIKNARQAADMYLAGADILVVGNAVENHPEKIIEIARSKFVNI